MKRSIHKSIRRLPAVLLALVLCIQTAAPALAADPATVYIDTVQDLEALAVQCSLDTWSQGKTVVLRADISLGGIDFSPIPTFGGTFDGGGYTISGLDLRESRSPAGLFGVIQPSGVVRDLRLSGAVQPDGSCTDVGSIAGINEGLLENCSFSGTVSGKDSVGGIVGTNALDGTVRGCTSAGSVTGGSRTGGIAGVNAGVLSSCRSDSYVNITSADPGLNLSDLELAPSAQLFTLRSLDTLNVATDTGGIAGYSSGMILSCVNTGAVGYPHVGYNVGGIAGRSCGHIARCSNHGTVLGRKDIGGIVGQVEPYVVLNLSQDTLETLRSQLNALRRLVDRSADHADASSSDLTDTLSQISGVLDIAVGHTQDLTEQLSDYGDSLLTEIDRGSDLLADTIDQLYGISQQVTDLADPLSRAFDRLSDAARELTHTGNSGAELQAAISSLKRAESLLKSGSSAVSEGLKQLLDAAEIQDSAAATEAIGHILTGIGQLSQAQQLASSAIETILTALIRQDPEALTDGLSQLRTAMRDHSTALSNIVSGLRQLQGSISFDPAKLAPGLGSIRNGAHQISLAGRSFSAAVIHLQKALSGTSGSIKAAAAALADGLGLLSGVSEDGGDILADVEDLLDSLSDADPIQFAHPSEEIGASADALYDTIHDLNSRMDQLSSSLDGSAHTLTSDLRTISGQLHALTGTLLDAVEEAENGDDIFSDTSQSDIDAVTNGKLLACENAADVAGDIDIGGIAGSIGVEYELDPESELLSSDTSLYRREYELKAILQNCSNTGKITSRRDYAGSICGRMELGLITGCYGGGAAESENGSFVGGIAGSTTAVIRDSFAKCRLSGQEYVGGIVGTAAVKGSTRSVGEVTRCHALVQVSSEVRQYAGAISGADLGAFRDNTFVSDGLAGIGGVSIAGKAQPVPYETLLETPGLPEAFRRFQLRFLAQDQVLKTVTFHYGDTLDPSVFPDIPQEEGSFAVWDRQDLSDLRFDTDVTAVYTPCISALPSQSQRDDGRPVFLVEGQFTDVQQLSEQPSHIPAVYRRTPDSLRTSLEQWQLEIPADGLSAHSVRYLSPTGKHDGLEIYALSGQRWEKLDTDVIGSYLRFDLPEDSSQLAVVERTSLWWLWLLVGMALGAAVLAVVLRRRYRKKTAALHLDQPAPTENAPAVPSAPPSQSARPQPVSRRRRLLRLGAVAALVLILGIIWFIASGAGERLSAYLLLHKYVQKEELSMTLVASADMGGQHYTLSTDLDRTQAEGQRITRAEQDGVALYYAGGSVFLENGRSFDTGILFPDYSTLLENAEALYRAAHVSLYENSGERIYSITVTGQDAEALLAHLFPTAAVRFSAARDVDIDLIASGGELTGIRFAAGGSVNDIQTDLSLHLSVDPEGQPPEIPQAVREQLLSPDAPHQPVPAGELLHLLTAWLELNAADPFQAEVALSASCGPLVADDQLTLYRTWQEDLPVRIIQKNGRTLYFTDRTLCDETGDTLNGSKEDIIRSADLPELAYRLCMNGSLVHTAHQGADQYTLSLSGEDLTAVAEAILPQLTTVDATLTGGSIQISLMDERIQSIRFTCDGSAKVLLSEVPVSLRAEVTPQAAQDALTIPEDVLDTLQKGE